MRKKDKIQKIENGDKIEQEGRKKMKRKKMSMEVKK